ncbi:hypothetical protein [Streptomyces xantholiticus]|uniref:Uncharacterized protein n=1 Tax=Streptomyces xantholiticus TaxID=68285 RepID=A0ABV1UR96_9ACTN
MSATVREPLERRLSTPSVFYGPEVLGVPWWRRPEGGRRCG